jgi:hypothetical protein
MLVFEAGQAESCGKQPFAPDRHCLRTIAHQQPAGSEAGERASEMRAADGIEGRIDAGADFFAPR